MLVGGQFSSNQFRCVFNFRAHSSYSVNCHNSLFHVIWLTVQCHFESVSELFSGQLQGPYHTVKSRDDMKMTAGG